MSHKYLNEEKLITIITVVLNGEEFLEETIQSIISQTYRNIEYIIIDGNSKDHTLDIIKKYDFAIDQWISEKDCGLYDAMNKGINLANGSWINFMNCGDRFSSCDVLSKIFNSKNLSKFHVIYGNHEIIYPSKKNKYVKSGKIEDLWKGSKFCHQASFTNSSLLKKYMFDTRFHFAADFNFFYRISQSGAIFKYLDFLFASISSGGISDRNRILVLCEWWNIIEKSPKTYFFYLKEALSQIVKLIIKLLLRKF